MPASVNGYHRRVAFGQTTRGRLALFGGLYFAQGVPWGLLTVALPQQLTSHGIGIQGQAAIKFVTWIPWVGKPLLGMLLDRIGATRFGRRRPWVLLAEAGMLLTLLALVRADPASTLFGALVFANSALTALQDVATDALALDQLPVPERGRANGVMWAGKILGAMVGGPGLAFLGGAIGWNAAYLAAALLLLAPAALVLPLREADAQFVPTAYGRELARALVAPGALLALLFALVGNAGASFVDAIGVPLFRLQVGLSEQQVNTLSLIGQLAWIGGAVMGGALSDRIGRRRALVAGTLAMAASMLIFAAARRFWPSFAFEVGFAVGGGLVSGLLGAAAIAFFMDLTGAGARAAHFQTFMALLSLRSAWAVRAGGAVAAQVPAQAMFALGGALELCALPLLFLLRPAEKSPSQPAAPPS
jgi:PAT family beta-lactamase induction signal transducer AmpG